MKPNNPYAEALGRLGGQSKSKAKAEAARKNGLKGGRPKRLAAARKKEEQTISKVLAKVRAQK